MVPAMDFRTYLGLIVSNSVHKGKTRHMILVTSNVALGLTQGIVSNEKLRSTNEHDYIIHEYWGKLVGTLVMDQTAGELFVLTSKGGSYGVSSR